MSYKKQNSYNIVKHRNQLSKFSGYKYKRNTGSKIKYHIEEDLRFNWLNSTEKFYRSYTMRDFIKKRLVKRLNVTITFFEYREQFK